MKRLLFILLAFLALCEVKSQTSGVIGFKNLKIKDVWAGTGNMIITDTQTVNSWNRSWSDEPSIFYDSLAGNVKIYFTGGSDSIENVAFNNKIGVTTTTDFVTFSSPLKCFGQGFGGAAIGTRAHSSWEGKIGSRYYA